MQQLTIDQKNQLRYSLRTLSVEMTKICQVFYELDGETADALNAILAEKYPFNFDLEELSTETKNWSDNIESKIDKL